jgi:hypothetical protein
MKAGVLLDRAEPMPMARCVWRAVMAALLAPIVASQALASPAEEKRIVEVMIKWADFRRSGNETGAAAAATEARALIARERPDLAGPPPAPQSAVFAYVLELATKHQPGARAKLEASFTTLQANSTRSVLYAVSQALEHYRMDRGDYPASGAKALAKALMDPANPYVKLPADSVNVAGELVDGWGRPLRYAPDSEGRLVLYSFGPNGKDDGGQPDDVMSPR